MPPSPGSVIGTSHKAASAASLYSSQSAASLKAPSYTRRTTSSSSRGRAEHVYSLLNSKGTPWCSLRFHSAAHTAHNVPVFWEGDTIDGTLELDESKDNIVQIDIIAAGRVVTSIDDYDTNVFMKITQTVACRKDKPAGSQSWPFSLVFPRQVTVTDKAGSQTSFLPPTFLERNTRVSVQYDLFAHVRRGRFRSDSRVGTVIAYVPSIQPGPPSRLRQLAYRRGSRIKGPSLDPQGWVVLKPTPITGTIFNDRPIRAVCTLALATPLCYTKGTAIPCVLFVESPDAQALDILSSPKAVDVRLQRCVTYSSIPPSQRTHAVRKEWNTSFDFPSSATFWPGPPCENPHQRQLDGEIQLSPHLKPSCAIMHFSITYNVVMFPFDAVGLGSSDKSLLLTEQVDIGTLFAEGPKVKVYSTPKYADSSSKFAQFNPDHPIVSDSSVIGPSGLRYLT
ncbi:hypothetical protein FIBSPDRAFT_813420 [Athelia psychrophila]|uniref:Arrestin-like N-terminal domain-containing protein n=1 Tax=Athelia psychrophila TaxID=1759441 RepID=A0A166UK29_9AGAM|nr:hypothetical protein FIBSPDRAFT_813420 [Fibularhizoctonia sp. CBS 109695]